MTNDTATTERDEFMRLWTEGVNHDLDPELEDYMDDTGFMGTCLKHPLVFQVPYFNPGVANAQLKAKKEALERAYAEKAWNTVVYLHERPYRLDAILSLDPYAHPSHKARDPRPRPTRGDWWELVADVWVDSENIWQNEEEWLNILQHPGAHRFRKRVMDEDELRVFDGLPATITAYRGATRDLNEDGLSWTLDRDKAEWFARRFTHKGEGVVLTGEVPRDDVFAYFGGRGESELVLKTFQNYRVTLMEEVAA